MKSTEKETHGVLLSEETMMNNNNNKVHFNLLKTQLEPPKSFCSSMIYWSIPLFIILYISVLVDVSIRLELIAFGVLLNFLIYLLGIAKDLAIQPNKLPPIMDTERILGEIIHSFWVIDGGQEKRLWYLIVEYTFEGVTYQATYFDDTFGLLATEKYMELIVNRANPKEPLSALDRKSVV